MNLCDRIQVLNFGVLIAEGDAAATVRADPDVVAAYLGSGDACLSSMRRHSVALRRHPRAATASPCTVGAGEAVAVIGSNGAGKSTHAARRSPGCMRAAEGTIRYEGTTITQRVDRPHRARWASRHCPEGRRVFGRLTRPREPRAGRHPAADRARSTRTSPASAKLFPVLAERLGQTAGTLSGGEQQMLAIARALMAQAAPADARRAVAGPGAAHGGAHLRGHRRAQGRRA